LAIKALDYLIEHRSTDVLIHESRQPGQVLWVLINNGLRA